MPMAFSLCLSLELIACLNFLHIESSVEPIFSLNQESPEKTARSNILSQILSNK